MSVHVYPLEDIAHHELKGWRCACQPTVEAVKKIDGYGRWTIGWLVTHNSYDGRERHELF